MSRVGQALLLDTHALIWWQATDPPLLSSRAYDAIADPGNAVFVSAASIWEISIKRARGKLDVPGNVLEALEENGFRELPITAFHAERAGSLPLHHTDPFDRMLVAQAQAEGLILVTRDANIPRYGVRTLTA
ncbi:MAG: type II toxin-antitoxin system VapC family toxin [Chloroflexi bacterium]|nr:type II toxin-antitoxin system VapC family toxin [Chloroflexota bacterium]